MSRFTMGEQATHCENASPVGNTVEWRPRKPRIVWGTIPRQDKASGAESSISERINAGHWPLFKININKIVKTFYSIIF